MKVGVALANSGMIRALERVLAASEHRLVWRASSAAETIQRAAAEPADVILIGADIAGMSAAELTRRLLARSGTAVLLVSDRRKQAIAAVYEAMGAGALDVLALPDSRPSAAETELVLAKLRTAGRLLGGAASNSAIRVSPKTGGDAENDARRLIALGASTGGPQALLTILAAFPANTQVAIVIVQHVDAEFSEGLASWLQDGSAVRVEVARAGSRPSPGTALLAGTRDHLVIAPGGAFRYTAEPRDLAYRPSVDVLFDSLADHWRRPAAAALLTGMGRDGAKGLNRLKKAGWLTFAQDEASSVVYGMPKAAVELGAASKVLPPAAIATELAEFARR